ncbi:hypothetical protein NFI96_016948 [Prochilodus magdalenae]|nr:hypothetical protein NFI96_016948 [Prochilodus magdalenae]
MLFMFPRLQPAVDAIGKKATEFTDLERQNETDDLLVSVSAAARVVIFYWDRFLEYTESPEFYMEVGQTEGVFETFSKTMEEMEGIARSLVESNLFMDIFGLLRVYLEGVDRVFSMPYDPFMVMGDSTRAMRTRSALSTVGMIVGARVWEKIYEIEMFPMIKQCYLRTLDMTYVLVGEADFETFRGVIFQHWRPFRDEAHRVLEEERRNITVLWLPPVRAGVRLLQTYSNKLANENIDDSGTKHLAKNFDKIRTFYTEKLLTNGIVTQKELDEFQRIFVGEMWRLLHLAGEHEIRGCVWNLYKASMVFINVTSSRLTESWNFISV